MRRIKKYRKDLSEGACLIRAVRDEEELEYISINANKIREIVKKYNVNNEIVYLVLEHMELPLNFREKLFRLQIDEYRGTNHDVLRSLFDTNPDFIDWCIENYDEERRKVNLEFERKKENARGNILVRAQLEICKLLYKIRRLLEIQ